jgi:PAS domain S-box-containing protein
MANLLKKKQFIVLTGLTLLGVFLLSTIWEFLIEDWVSKWVITNHTDETTAEKWRFVFTAVTFSGIALILPIIWILRNQSQQNSIENNLKESDERYHNLFQTISDPLLIMDADSFKLEDVNDSASKEYGYTREELLNMSLREISAEPDSTEKAIKANLAGTLKKIPLRYHKKKDGTVFPAELTTGTFTVNNKKKVFAIVRNISKQKIAEEKLKESEKKFRSLVSHMPGAVYRCACDSDWTMTFISHSIEEISGYPASDFIQNDKRSYASIIHPEDTQYVEDTVLRAVEKKEPFVLNYRILYKDHEVRWVFEKGQGIYYENGILQYLDGAIFDVTEHKTTELALQASEERLKLAMAGTTDGLWDWNVATGEVYYSPRWMSMLGYAPNELEQNFQTWEKIVHPDDKEHSLKAVNNYLNGNTSSYEIEHRLRAKDGGWKWILSRGKIFEWDTKKNPLRMTGTHIDITEKKKIEEKLKESEEIACTLFTQLSSIVSGTAPATSGEDFFQSLVYHLAVALKVSYVFIDETTDRKNTFRTLAFSMHGEIVDNIEYDVVGTPCEAVYKGQDVIYPDKLREKFPHDAHIHDWGAESYIGLPLLNHSGEVIGLLGFMDKNPIADVDSVKSILSIFASRAGAELQRRSAEDRLSKKAVELERVNKELQDFAHIASHDLQEPLRKIIILGDRLEPTLQDSNEKGQYYLDRMQKSAGRMRGFIEDLLHYTRVEMKALPFEPVDLNEISKDIINELEYRLKETQGTVNIKNLPVIEADPFQMRQLFLNMIGNGLKFHREEIPPVINLDSVCKKNGIWEISVEDNGIGIEAQHIDRIFKPFERLHSRNAFEGTGIGLTICNKITTRHGGDISVKKNSQNGVTFHITLPKKQNGTRA